MKRSSITKVDRRTFLKTSTITASGLVLGFQIGCSGTVELPPASFDPNVYLNINEKGEVKIIAHRSEMGQGVRTSIPTILAEELEADWSRIEIVQAVGDEAIYGNQNTDGSFSVRMFFMPMRKAGAAARMMLEQAAANKWQVDVSECKAKNHQVVHETSGKSFGFGELAGDASALEVPDDESVKLKDINDFNLIGTGVPIIDLKNIVTGKANYGLDKDLPGQKVACIQRCPVHGGSVKTYNSDKALAIEGVEKVFTLDSPGFPPQYHNPLGGVVVVAANTWAAIKGKEALEIEWDYGINAGYNTDEFMVEMAANAKKSGTVRREQGNVRSAQKAGKTLEATYKLPHLSHTPMEPPCGVASVADGKCEVWMPTQHPQWARSSLAGILGIEEDKVTVNVTLLGGGFGRKSKPDFIVEAALISKECGCPIQLIWSREDDIQHDFLHACSVQQVKVSLDKGNKVTGWHQCSVFPSISGTADPAAIEPTSGEMRLGLNDLPFDIPNILIETNKARAQVRIGWLRSVCNIQHAFAIGSMVDEVAIARNLDPVENILDLLGSNRNIPVDKLANEEYDNYGEPIEEYPWNTGRLKNVIELVAEKSNWGKSLPSGRAQGIAAHRSFLTYVACVVEVEVKNEQIIIPEIHYGVDCGIAVNPDRVRSQFEGGAVFALSFALKSAITLKDGQVVQGNFNDYELARMVECPGETYVHLVDSKEKPTGVGEPPVPPIAPALCNAIYAATGKRIRELPIKLS